MNAGEDNAVKTSGDELRFLLDGEVVRVRDAPPQTTLLEFLRDNPDPTEKEVRIAISGNLCRCTGYQGIVNAALDAAKRLQGVRP